jgi:hypothetical protein
MGYDAKSAIDALVAEKGLNGAAWKLLDEVLLSGSTPQIHDDIRELISRGPCTCAWDDAFNCGAKACTKPVR